MCNICTLHSDWCIVLDDAVHYALCIVKVCHSCYGLFSNPGVVRLHILGETVNMFSPLAQELLLLYRRRVLWACFGPKWPPKAPLEHPEKEVSFTTGGQKRMKFHHTPSMQHIPLMLRTLYIILEVCIINCKHVQ